MFEKLKESRLRKQYDNLVYKQKQRAIELLSLKYDVIKYGVIDNFRTNDENVLEICISKPINISNHNIQVEKWSFYVLGKLERSYTIKYDYSDKIKFIEYELFISNEHNFPLYRT